MVVLLVMFTAIMAIIYAITRESMAREAESRYESIILNANEKIRGVLSDVYVGAINNISDIERDLDSPDVAGPAGADGQPEHVYVELPSDLRTGFLLPERT